MNTNTAQGTRMMDTNKPQVTQEDREAASALFRDERTDLAVKFRLGANPEPLLETLALHRQRAEAKAAPEPARDVVEAVERLNEWLSVTHGEEGHGQLHKDVATALAALSAAPSRDDVLLRDLQSYMDVAASEGHICAGLDAADLFDRINAALSTKDTDHG